MHLAHGHGMYVALVGIAVASGCTDQTGILIQIHQSSEESFQVDTLQFFVGHPDGTSGPHRFSRLDIGQGIVSLSQQEQNLAENPYRLLLRKGELMAEEIMVVVVGRQQGAPVAMASLLTPISFVSGKILHWDLRLAPENVANIVATDQCIRWQQQNEIYVVNDPEVLDCEPCVDIDPNGDGAGCKDLSLWLNASYLHENSTTIEFWHDHSGNRRHASQPLVDTMPTYQAGVANGRPAVAFSDAKHLTLGDQYIFASESGEGLSVFVVVQSDQPSDTNEEFLFDFGHYADSGYGIAYSQTGARIYVPTVGSVAGQFRDPSREFVVLSMIIKLGEIHALWRNEILSVSQNIPNLTDLIEAQIAAAPVRGQEEGPVTLGHQSKQALDTGRHFHGQVAELLVYQRAFTPAERRSMSCHLAANYAIALEALCN